MSNPKTIVLRIPAQPQATMAEIFATLGLGRGNGDGVAEWFQGVSTPWTEDNLVWLCPVEVAKFECLHALYGEVVKQQSVFTKPLGVHGLFCLAAFLKENEVPELKTCSGIVHAFAGSKPGMKMVLNHSQGTASDVIDLSTPVLYMTGGRPRSIYQMWHTDPSEERAFIAWCGSTSIHDLEEAKSRLEEV